MDLRLTQALTEISISNLLGGKVRPARNDDNLTAICQPTAYKMWDPRRLTTLSASMACYKDIFIYFYFYFALTRKDHKNRVHLLRWQYFLLIPRR
jgi:hypothetical protein